jgi:hypothetical protein
VPPAGQSGGVKEREEADTRAPGRDHPAVATNRSPRIDPHRQPCITSSQASQTNRLTRLTRPHFPATEEASEAAQLPCLKRSFLERRERPACSSAAFRSSRRAALRAGLAALGLALSVIVRGWGALFCRDPIATQRNGERSGRRPDVPRSVQLIWADRTVAVLHEMVE